MKIKILLTAIIVALLLFSTSTNAKENKMPATEGYIQVTGGKVWYRIAGADKKGISLLLVHGGPGAPHDYLEPLEALSDERPVIFYDQLDCGNSERSKDTSLWRTERFVEELGQVRAALKLEKVHILGQSWGSMLALEYYVRKNPEGIVSFIFSGPYFSSKRWSADQRKWISELPEAVRGMIEKTEASGDYSSQEYQDAMNVFYGRHLCRLDKWPDCMTRTMEKMGTDVYTYMWGPSEFTITGILKDADVSGELHKLKMPVLFTCGEYDEAAPETTEYYHSLVQGSEMYVLKGASHEHNLEKPEEYNGIIRAFLKNTENK
jgi:proline iminopeptidase